MSTKRAPEPEAVRTSGEIHLDILQHYGRRHVITEDLREIYKNAMREGNRGEPAPMDDDEKASREHAARLLNGSAPDNLLTRSVTRERSLFRERRGIDIALDVLSKMEEKALDREAADWVATHTDEWRSLARQITLTAITLKALEEKAKNMLEEGLRGRWVQGLAMSGHIGPGYSMLGLGDTLEGLRNAAIEQGVVTKSEIRAAERGGLDG
jgi:hypothetical protein